MYEFTWHLLISAGSEAFKLQGHWVLTITTSLATSIGLVISQKQTSVIQL